MYDKGFFYFYEKEFKNDKKTKKEALEIINSLYGTNQFFAIAVV